MKSSRLLSGLLCMLLLCAVVFSGCNKKDNTSADNPSTFDEVVSQTGTTDSSDEKTTGSETLTPTAPPDSTADSTESKEIKPADKKPTQPQQNNQNSNDNPPQSNNQGGNSSDSGNSENMTCIVTVGEKDYNFKLGDKFTYTCYLKTPDKIEDIQAKLMYTNRTLKLLSTEDTDMLPVLSKFSPIINTKDSGIVKYNATGFKGIDFSNEGILITLKFEVVFGGSASIVNTLEVMTGIDSTDYVDNFKLAKGVSTRETIN